MVIELSGAFTGDGTAQNESGFWIEDTFWTL